MISHHYKTALPHHNSLPLVLCILCPRLFSFRVGDNWKACLITTRSRSMMKDASRPHEARAKRYVWEQKQAMRLFFGGTPISSTPDYRLLVSLLVSIHLLQGVVTAIGAVVTAATGVKIFWPLFLLLDRLTASQTGPWPLDRTHWTLIVYRSWC